MAYGLLLTNAGAAALAAAFAKDDAIKITKVAVGDGGGAPVIPLPTAGALVRKVHEVAPTSVSALDSAPGQVVVVGVISSNVGGWVIREVGLYAGDLLVAYGNVPDTVKPVAADGAVSDVVLSLYLAVEHTAHITINTAPGDAISTKDYVDRAIAGLDGVYAAMNHIHVTSQLTAADKTKLDQAVQSATLGGSAIVKNGTILQFPAYPVIPASLPASDVSAWAKVATKPAYTAAEVGAAAATHTHAKVQISDFPASMPASDVSAWAKANTKPAYTAAEVGAATATQGTKADAAVQSAKIGTTAVTKSGTELQLPAYPTTLPASDVYAWAKATTKPAYTAAEIGAATSAQGTAASSAVQEATIGGAAVAKSGTTLQLPAYPVVPISLPASDVYAWAKAATKPTYTASEVGALSSYGSGSGLTSLNASNISSGTLNGARLDLYLYSTAANTNYPIGSYLMVTSSSQEIKPNTTVSVYYLTSWNYGAKFRTALDGQAGVQLSGTWVMRGSGGADSNGAFYLAQRIY